MGAATSRIDANDGAFLLHPNLLEIVTALETRSGLLALVTRANDNSELVARVEGEQIAVDAGDAMHAASAVHQLLHRKGIFIDSEGAGI